MDWQQYIERNPEILLGKPVIKGTRISVELIMRKLAGGYSFADILKAYPEIPATQFIQSGKAIQELQTQK